MHWVTKVFIVGAAVLSVLLAALVMAYSVNVKEIRDAHANLLAQKQAAEANASVQSTQFAAAKIDLDNKIAAMNNDSALLRQQTAQLQTENSAARADKLRAEANVESITAKIQQLAETNKTLTTLLGTMHDELGSLREAELKFRKREIELVDRNNDLESQNEVLKGQSNALGEQVAELRDMMEAIKSGGTGQAGDQAIPRAINAFTGRVTEVSRDPNTGDLLAEVSVGTNDGVKDRMELWLARDGQLLGKLTVIKTDLRTAVGRVDTLSIKDPKGKAYEIHPEDQVYSSVFR